MEKYEEKKNIMNEKKVRKQLVYAFTHEFDPVFDPVFVPELYHDLKI